MDSSGPSRASRLVALVLSTVLLTALFIVSPAPEASASGNPCPGYSIQNVFDDPNGDWDNDRVGNSDELYNGLDPCTSDTATFCSGTNALCRPVKTVTKCSQHVEWYPNGDYDGDGVNNATEVRHYANPCKKPCPHPSNADVSLNPWGNWDGDRVNNVTEVRQGTNPCNGYNYNPCPYWSHNDVKNMPGYDWDYDGISNSNEVRNGTNPCTANQQKRLPHVTQRTPQPKYVPTPAPAPRAQCPYGYPYYHPGNGLCYANPVGRYHY